MPPCLPATSQSPCQRRQRFDLPARPWPELDHRWPIVSRSREHGLHRSPPPPTAAQAAAEEHYRRGISRRSRERKLAFQGGSCCIPQALPNIAGSEIGILGQNLLLGPATSKKSKDGGDGNTKTANARNAAHLCRIDGDELKVLHAASVYIVARRLYTAQVAGQWLPATAADESARESLPLFLRAARILSRLSMERVTLY